MWLTCPSPSRSLQRICTRWPSSSLMRVAPPEGRAIVEGHPSCAQAGRRNRRDRASSRSRPSSGRSTRSRQRPGRPPRSSWTSRRRGRFPPSAVRRIAAGSQPLALTTTTVRSAGRCARRPNGFEGAERIAQIGCDPDVAEPEPRRPVDFAGVGVNGHDCAPAGVAGGGERQFAGMPGAQCVHGAAPGRQRPGLGCGRADVVDRERGVVGRSSGTRAQAARSETYAVPDTSTWVDPGSTSLSASSPAE